MVKNILIALKNLQRMQLKLVQKKQLKKSEVTSELIDNRIVDKITSVSKFSAKYSMKLY